MFLLSTNITSPLGMTTRDNYRAAAAGQTAVAHHKDCRGVPFGFEAALLNEEQWRGITLPGYTPFESMAIHSAREALSHTGINTADKKTILILSTTKGDITATPAASAARIAQAIGMTTEPIVVCNACISGVAAQVLALRMIDSGQCDTTIVTGADVLTDFIISGFQSLKALSPEPCRPFDAERLGLNLGEAAATMIFGRQPAEAGTQPWQVAAGAISNDAYHISGPHPKGEGCLRALRQVAGNKEELAAISVHGTATMYNDQMESVAIERAGMSDIPLSALKGYYGHTMGAAGLLETIITATALDHGIILPSKGYSERGVSGKVTISPNAMTTAKREFIKIISGFGGGNAAIRMTRNPQPPHTAPTAAMSTVDTITLTNPDTKALYHALGCDYPRFHKMDALSRIAFIATETLLRRQQGGISPQNNDCTRLKDGQQGDISPQDNDSTRLKDGQQSGVSPQGNDSTRLKDGQQSGVSPQDNDCTRLKDGQESETPMQCDDNVAVILFNRTSSVVADRQYLATISDKAAYFPSPALFVHTLPNISAGEIALRHHYHGETSFYILPRRNAPLMEAIVSASLSGTGTRTVITGWIDCPREGEAECELSIMRIQQPDTTTT